MLSLVAGIAGIPAAALLGAAAFGYMPLTTALGIAVITISVAVVLVSLLRRDERKLSQVIRRLAADEPESGTVTDSGLILLENLGRDIDHLIRTAAPRAALVEQLRRADTLILERLPDPLIVLADDRSVRRANDSARNAYGDDMAAVMRHPDLRNAIDRMFATGAVQTAELTLPVPVERDVHASVVPMDPPLSDGGRAIVVLSDRTRDRMVERMRADFVANVSHELRTPLTSLIGFVETLQGPASDDPPAQKRFLGIMAEQGARMNRLIDDLLSLSRIELTEHQSPSEMVDLKELATGVVAGFEPRLAQRANRIDLTFDEELPGIVGDTDQIAQVLQNLLENAVKYGRDGGTIGLRIERTRAGDRWPARAGVVMVVTDQGVGIARDHIPRLTERFYRVDKGRSRAVGGTGLGLAIVKHIVNRHRGQLVIESEPGIGTAISVWLPLVQPGSSNRPQR